MNLSIQDIDAFIFDFDGVLTNNKVTIDSDGIEYVECSRSDGLGFDVLRSLQKPFYIISTEKNPVVTRRADKIGAITFQNTSNKLNCLEKIIDDNDYCFEKVCFFGNDLNDFFAMKHCGIRVCPSDSHPKIIEISNFALKSKGGSGVLREFLEENCQLNLLEFL